MTCAATADVSVGVVGAAVPEPSGALLFAVGFAVAGSVIRRSRQR